MTNAVPTTTLGAVVDLVMGQAPSSEDTNFDGLGTPFVKVGEFGSVRPVIREWTTNPLRLARRTDVLLCVVGATCGKINLGEECAIGRSVAAIRPNPSKLDQHYLYFFMQTIVKRLRSGSIGAAQTVISKEMVESVEIPVPPLAEQLRVVGLLNKAFAGLATAQTHAEKNLQNSRALFESHLQSIFAQRGKWWKDMKLGDFAEFKNGLNFTQRSKGQRLRIVGVGDFQDNAVVPTEALQSVTIDGTLSDDYLIRRDDILTVRSNGSKELVGRCMLVPEMDGKTSYSGFIIRIRFDTTSVSPRFLLRYMKSGETRTRLTREGGGANISNINQAKLSELPISMPSFSEQEDIADRLDSIAINTQRLENLYQQKQAALAALKESLLYEAFSGQL